jgi:predicted MFS family arabinose efflux permease
MSTSRSMAWIVWFIGSIFYAYQYILRVMPNIMLDNIMQQFHIDASVFGQYSGVYYIGYSLMHLPLGILLDRYGPRKIMSGCMVLTVLGLLPILFADHWVYPIVGRFLTGMGSSAAILGTFKIIRLTFKEERFTQMLSLAVTIGLIGAIYGGGPVSYMCSALGYQVVVQIFSALGIGLAVLTYLIVPDIEATAHRSVSADVKEVLSNRKVLAVCFFSGLLVGPLEGFADVWGSTFLKQVYGFDASIASYLPSMIFIGMCFGSPVLSFIAERTRSYIGCIVGSGIIMMVSFIALIAGILSQEAIMMNFIVVGICCSYQILAIYKASTYVPEHVAGLTTAVVNMIIMSFGYAFHSVIGSVIDFYGGLDETKALVYGIGVIPITLSVGIIGFTVLLYQDTAQFKKTSAEAA